MKLFKTVIFSVILCVSLYANTDIQLKGTKWSCAIAEDCINVYEFLTDSTYKYISCEMLETYYGTYYFVDNFLMLDEKPDDSDNHLSCGCGRAIRKLYKAKTRKNELQFISVSDWEKDRWIKTNFKFDSNNVFKKQP